MTKSSTHNLSDAHRKTTPKAAAGKARLTNGKTAPRVAVGEPRAVAPRRVPKVAAGTRDAAPKPVPNVTTERTGDRKFELQVPSSMQALAERNVTQAREVYERSKNTLHAVLESLDKSCEGAVALNRKIIDIAERNVTASFDLAMSLAGAKNLAEVMNLQADYWRRQFDNLGAQAEELRALSTKVATSVTEPIKAQVTHGKNP
jgi:phasin